MLKNLRERAERGEYLYGTHTFMGCPEYLEIVGGMDYDFVFICAEHPAYGIERIYDMVKRCEAAGTPALVRLPEYDLTLTKKVLDMGVSAVLFPMIRSAKEAERAMNACLYPPYGTRGFGPMSAVKWGLESEKDFVDGSLNGTLRMIQIEHIDAVNDLENIIKNPYIDGYVLGPNDLAASIGHIGDMYHEDVKAVLEKTVKILKSTGKIIGLALVSFSREDIEYWKSLGVKMFSVGGDSKYLREGARADYGMIKEFVEGEHKI